MKKIFFLFLLTNMTNLIYGSNMINSKFVFKLINPNVPQYAINDLIKEILIDEIVIEPILFTSKAKLLFKNGFPFDGKELIVHCTHVDHNSYKIETSMLTHIYKPGVPCTEHEETNLSIKITFKQNAEGTLIITGKPVFEAWYFKSFDICHDQEPVNIVFGTFE